MPCNTVVTNTVVLGEVAQKHPDLLEAAIAGEFGKVTRLQGIFSFQYQGYVVRVGGGRATSQMPENRLQEVVGRVNQAVARTAVKTAARRFGWTVVPGADANHFQVVKK